ncbi:MAG: hypothetical protein ACI8R4_002717 [Paracoccaceae bacterium]|jgi:hypothetical protein
MLGKKGLKRGHQAALFSNKADSEAAVALDFDLVRAIAI